MNIKQAKLSLFAEIRFPVYYKLTDKFGEIADCFNEDYKDIRKTPNGTDLILRQGDRNSEIKQIKINASSFWFSIVLCTNHGNFGESLKKEVNRFFDFIKIEEITWLGVREYQLNSIEYQNFSKLIANWRGNFFPNNIPFENHLGKASDMGISINFRELNLKGNLMYGFMEKSQSKNYFPSDEKTEKTFPDIGLFIDLDIYNDTPVSEDIAKSTVEHFDKSSNIMKQVNTCFCLSKN